MCTRSRKFENGTQINMMYHNIKHKIVKNKFTKQWKNLRPFLNITSILWVYFRFEVIFIMCIYDRTQHHKFLLLGRSTVWVNN